MRGATVKLLRKMYGGSKADKRWWRGLPLKRRGEMRQAARRAGVFKDGKWKRKLRRLRGVIGGLGKEDLGSDVSWWVLFNADFKSYRATGKPITGVQWMKTRKGPRPSGPWVPTKRTAVYEDIEEVIS